MTRRELKAAAERHEALMTELSHISVALEAMALAALNPLVIEGDDDILRKKLDEQEAKLRNADDVVMGLLARAEQAETELKAKASANEGLVEERQQLAAQVADQAKRADIAATALFEARLDLSNVEITIKDLRALAARRRTEGAVLSSENEILAAEIGSLKGRLRGLQAELDAARAPKSEIVVPRPAASAVSAKGAVALTPLAEQVRMLIGKGHSDASIKTIVNNCLAPEDWLNAGGVKALRALLGGSDAA